jgi:hypothetical protein
LPITNWEDLLQYTYTVPPTTIITVSDDSSDNDGEIPFVTDNDDNAECKKTQKIFPISYRQFACHARRSFPIIPSF